LTYPIDRKASTYHLRSSTSNIELLKASTARCASRRGCCAFASSTARAFRPRRHDQWSAGPHGGRRSRPRQGQPPGRSAPVACAAAEREAAPSDTAICRRRARTCGGRVPARQRPTEVAVGEPRSRFADRARLHQLLMRTRELIRSTRGLGRRMNEGSATPPTLLRRSAMFESRVLERSRACIPSCRVIDLRPGTSSGGLEPVRKQSVGSSAT